MRCVSLPSREALTWFVSYRRSILSSTITQLDLLTRMRGWVLGDRPHYQLGWQCAFETTAFGRLDVN